MLDSNGKFTQLTFEEALSNVLADAAVAGISVPSGSVEEQLAKWLAQELVDSDNAVYASTVLQYNPVGSDIDLQNPGFPRLLPTRAQGFLQIENNSGSTTAFPLNTIFTAPNGVTYTNPTAILTLDDGETGFLAVQSSTTGAAQNLPSMQDFPASSGITITNPQPITGGSDLETDSQYLNRLNAAKAVNSSPQATEAAKAELRLYYEACQIYVNSSNNGLLVPAPVPPQGLNVVILLASGINAGPEELAQAVRIITSRFEFGNLNNFNTTLHPILQGSSYTGVFPQAYSITVAQAVQSTVLAQLTVSFPTATNDEEKPALAAAYAGAFVQRLTNLLTGAAGNFHFSFTPSGDVPQLSDLPVIASSTPIAIAPFVSIEAIRSLISGAMSTGSQGGINLESLDNLSIEFDTNEYEQNPIVLSIFAPYEGTLATVDFVMDALFTDGTSWYDRYIFLDPDKITVEVVEL